jgi:hypothetical protein
VSICTNDRVDVANIVLQSFAPDTSLRIDAQGYVVVCWNHHGVKTERRWMTRGQDFYPIWHRKWGHGGTATTALAQLVRWIKGRPVLPLSTWIYWGGEQCRLMRQQGDDNGAQAISALRAAGYPETVPCVLCGQTLGSGGLDWWSLDKVTGPCCGMRSGCRQQRSTS